MLDKKNKEYEFMLKKLSFVRINYIYQCLKFQNSEQELLFIDPVQIMQKQKSRKEKELLEEDNTNQLFSYRSQLLKTLTQNSHLSNRKSNLSATYSMSGSGNDPIYNTDPMLKAIKFIFSEIKQDVDRAGLAVNGH